MDLERHNSSETTHAHRQRGWEQGGSVFQPDALSSSEYFEHRRDKSILQPEKRLMLAILEDAVSCFQQNHCARHGERKMMLAEVEEWIFGRSEWIFSFENICSVLGYNPDYVRAGLKRWREKEIANNQKLLWKDPGTGSAYMRLRRLVSAAPGVPAPTQ